MRIAFVFPGQGSQSVGMLDSISAEPAAAALIEEADRALGFPLSTLIHEGPAEELSLTVNTQPAMLLASVALFRLYEELGGPAPVVMAGHSLGEYSALTAAGAFSFEEALRLVRFRAETMQTTVPVGTGSMAAVLGLSDEAVEAALETVRSEGVIEAVNFNSPGQVVVAGEKAAVDALVARAKEIGAKRVLPLKVSAPFHSSLMKPAAEALERRLAETPVAAPAVPVLSNVDALPETEPGLIRTRLAQQACSPVQWVRTIAEMKKLGVTDLVECGPGKVLVGLLKRTDPSIRPHSINDLESLRNVVETLRGLAAAEA